MLELVASSRALAIILPTLGLVWGILQCALIGGLVRNMLSATPLPRKRWATDVALGIVVSAAYFTVRSFAAKLGAPRMAWFEPSLVAVVIAAARSRAVLRELLTAPLGFLAIVALTLAWGHWFMFHLDPASSDPAVIGIMVDAARKSGQIAMRLSPEIDTVLAYPMGIQALTLSLANPLLPTLSAVQGWLSLTVTLTAFMIFETVAPVLAAPWQRLLLFAATVGVRLGIGAFDVSDKSRYLEGASKRSLAFLLVLATICALQSRTQLATRRSVSLAIAFIAAAFVFLVNPISFYVSLTAALLILVAGAFDVRSTALAVCVSLCVFVPAVLQDGYLTKNLGPRGPACRVFASTLPYCTWDDTTRAATKRVETVIERSPPSFSESLSEMVTNPLLLLHPSTQQPFRTLPAAICALLLALVGVIALWRRQRRALVWVGGGLALLVMTIVLQTAIVVRTDQTMPYLIRGYTDTVYANVWQGLCFAAIIGGLAALIAHLPRRAAVVALALFTVVTASEIRAIGHAYGSSIGGHIGESSPRYARAFLTVQQSLRANDRLLLPGGIGIHPHERWYMPDFALSSLHFHSDVLILGSFSYPGLWPSFMPSLDEHDRLLNEGDCAYLDRIGATVTVELGTQTPLPPALRACFEVERSVDDLRVYRRKPH